MNATSPSDGDDGEADKRLRRQATKTRDRTTAPRLRKALRTRAAKGAWWFSKAVYKAGERFIYDDGLYMASALAFSIILAIFPFIIFMTATVGFLGGEALAQLLTVHVFDVFPEEVASTLEPEIDNVLRDATTGLVTFGLAVMLVSVSSAIETVRGGLNRAYGILEDRSVVRTRLESLLFIFVTTFALMLVALAAVVVPIVYNIALPILPTHLAYSDAVGRMRLAVTAAVLTLLLWALHRYLPDWKGPRPSVWPGILATLVLWYLAAKGFSLYLRFFGGYTRTYAGLAGIVAAMIFFYVASVILLFAGSLNRAFAEAWAKRRAELAMRRFEEGHARRPPQGDASDSG
ncbi:YihY/virulence factor BrkB family protein [Lutibaculum baratangense]|uniref:Putative ribonuclease BN n=1 Tax=Lutibaculum baratangense AMV1 TaxID=631454 RepID=V4RDD2_9HYPH|nr:YihY/virulence factor BrkB family protein [Lutibaculum baratangense]ESR24166.1 putative ribonuclease BN [Lutibaculum baratangense AMV1]